MFTPVGIVTHVDDLVLIYISLCELQLMADLCINNFAELNMVLNPKQIKQCTCLMRFRGKNHKERCSFVIMGFTVKVPVVYSFSTGLGNKFVANLTSAILSQNFMLPLMDFFLRLT
jgi:hypothetical protein